MGAVFFLLAFALCAAGAIVIALALRVPRIRKETAGFRRFVHASLETVSKGESALLFGIVQSDGRTLEVPHTHERAVWIRYRLEELGREFLPVFDEIVAEPFTIVASDDAAAGGRPLAVELAGAQIAVRERGEKSTSELFDEEAPEFVDALPESFRAAVDQHIAAKEGLYRVVVERIAVGESLILSGRVDEEALQLTIKATPEVPLLVSNQLESDVLSNPHRAWIPLGIAVGIALIVAALRIFFLPGPGD